MEVWRQAYEIGAQLTALPMLLVVVWLLYTGRLVPSLFHARALKRIETLEARLESALTSLRAATAALAARRR